MAKESITPASKPVPTSGGVKQGNSTLSTPMQLEAGKAPWGGKEAKNKIMGK